MPPLAKIASGGQTGADQRPPVPRLRAFVNAHGIAVLNVAGSREGKEPGIHDWTAEVLEAALFRHGAHGAGRETA